MNRANIRHRSKITRLYGLGGTSFDGDVELGPYVTTMEQVNSYDSYGNVEMSTVSADGLLDVVTVMTYQINDSLETNKYKVNFLTGKVSYSDIDGSGGITEDEYLSGVTYTQHANGRVQNRTQFCTGNASKTITTHYMYFDEGDGLHELKSVQIGSEPVESYTYELGNRDQKFINNRLVAKSEINQGSGLVYETYDLASYSTDNEFGNKTQFVYDSLNRLISKTPPEGDRYALNIRYDGNTVTYEKGGADLQSQWLDPMGNNTLQCHLTYDEDGCVDKIIKASAYNWRGLELISLLPESIYDDEEGVLSINYSYDCLGRVVEILESDKTTSIEYSLHDETDNPDIKTKKTVNINGVVHIYYYDLRNNLRRVVKGAPAGEASYIYDLKGNLIQVTHGETDRYFGYDLMNRRQYSYEPETGIIEYDYFSDGKLKWKDTPTGKIYYGYDTYNRQKTVECPKGRTIREYFYDEPKVNFSDGSEIQINNGLRRLTSLLDKQYEGSTLVGKTKLAWSYNQYGNIETESVQIKAPDKGFVSKTYTTTNYYDAWGIPSLTKLPVSETYIHYGNEVGNMLPTGTGPFTTNIKLGDPTHPDGIRNIVPKIVYNTTGGLKKLKYDNSIWMSLIPDYASRISEVVTKVISLIFIRMMT
ncbi:hypothetical protein K8T06_13185 [bacterium]|nr:hypothetical protein [bacterium]